MFNFWRRSPNWAWTRIRWEPGKEKPAGAGLQGGGHVGAEGGLRVHNVLAAREFRAGQNFLRCSRFVTLRWKSLSAALEAKRQSM